MIEITNQITIRLNCDKNAIKEAKRHGVLSDLNEAKRQIVSALAYLKKLSFLLLQYLTHLFQFFSLAHQKQNKNRK